MNTQESSAPTASPGRYLDGYGHVVTVVAVDGEIWLRRHDGQPEWWSHARWRREAVGWVRL